MAIDWYKKLTKLRVDKSSKNPAPHKPILLLAILDQIENGIIDSNIIKLTPELAFQFLGYWEIVSYRGRGIGRVELPFYYLKSDGFLKHIAINGLEAALNIVNPTSVDLLNKVISHAKMPNDFFMLMQNKENRNQSINQVSLKSYHFQILYFSWLKPEYRPSQKTLTGIENINL